MAPWQDGQPDGPEPDPWQQPEPSKWDPRKSGPEYHLNKHAPPRCLRDKCGMPMMLVMREKGPVFVCSNRRCTYEEAV